MKAFDDAENYTKKATMYWKEAGVFDKVGVFLSLSLYFPLFLFLPLMILKLQQEGHQVLEGD